MAAARVGTRSTAKGSTLTTLNEPEPSPAAQPEENVPPARRTLVSSEGTFVFHAMALLCYARVWLWHFTPAAAVLPGATGFGWFFRYLTFYSFTLQFGTLLLCCIAALPGDAHRRAVLHRWTDDMSCALFGLANVVTIMYYAIATATNDIVEGGAVPRPPWLGFSVHVFNSLIAWADLLISHPRSFSPRAEKISMLLTSLYTSWILLCSHFNGVFPYPFLNKMAWPQGFIGIVVASHVVFYIMFHAGKRLSAPILRWKLKKE
ncbi:hypothetical protein WJX72_003239 [[Myrmecia] bisecta]|uniref:Uncharacterized protein n=1 Tax=[Myrmecia] bisecta TaxID=41462 RepID=A0AAW1Q4T2_9CHLO